MSEFTQVLVTSEMHSSTLLCNIPLTDLLLFTLVLIAYLHSIFFFVLQGKQAFVFNV